MNALEKANLFGKVLLPVEFSDRCRGAARYVDALAEKFHPKVTVLHVLPPPHYEATALEVSGPMLDEIFAQREKAAREQLGTFLCEELKDLDTQRVLLEGDPASRIVAYAHDEQFDLIVMPTHGYGPFRRFILGSVTAKVLHDADCPVWTGTHLEAAPPTERIQIRTVVAAIDIGPQMEKTLAYASRFASTMGARFLAVHAAPSIEGKVGEYFDPDWRLYFAKQAREKVEESSALLPVKPEVLIEYGDPPKAVTAACLAEKADLLFIGRGTAAGIFGRMRANAYSIIQASPCPVVSV